MTVNHAGLANMINTLAFNYNLVQISQAFCCAKLYIVMLLDYEKCYLTQTELWYEWSR